MKKNLLKGAAALAMGFALVSCTQGFDFEKQEQQASLDNAQQTLGFYIPDNQDWVMTSTVTADIPINFEAGETYTVKVYSNDPLMDGVGYVLVKETVANGQNFTASFRAASYKQAYSIGITNSEGKTMYRTAYLEDGKLTAFVEDQPIETNRSATRSITINGDIYSTFTAPTADQIAAAFPTSIPASALEVADLTGNLYFVYKDNNTGRNYKITKTGTVEIGGSWNNDNDKAKANNIYINVDGNVTIKRNGAEYMNIYVLKGNVTLDSNFGECGGLISVAKGAILNDSRDHIAHNGGIQLFNKGTVNATNTSKYDIGNNAAVYNEGSFAATGNLSYSAGAGNTSFFMNMGDDAQLSAPSMTLNSTCHFFTDGTVNIAGETRVTQKDIVWINNGHYTTGSMVFSANNGTFYNYCQLIVTNNCSFIDGAFNMMDNSYAEFGTGLFNNFHVVMGNNAGINIKNGSKWGRQGAGIMQGFYAKDDNAKCFVRLGGQNYVPDHKGAAFHVSGKNLTLAYNNMKFFSNYNAIGLSSTFSGVNYWDETNAQKLKEAKSENTTWNLHNVTNIVPVGDFSQVTVSTKTGQCAATWTVPGDPIPEENNWWTYAFEDNKTRCDFDLNDVVLQVKINDNNDNKLDVKLVAAGCQYDNYVWLGDTRIAWVGGSEVHEALGADHGVMINTGKGVDKNPVTVTIDKPLGFDFQNADFKIRPFKIGTDPTVESNATDDYITIVKVGNPEGIAKAPLGIVIPDIWKWPTERTNINDAYSGFAEWGKQADLTLREGLGGWYQSANSGSVYE